MPTKRARVSGRKPLQGFHRVRPEQGAGAGGLMAPGTTGERGARGESGAGRRLPGPPAGCARVPFGGPLLFVWGAPRAGRESGPGLRPRLEARGCCTFAPSPSGCGLPKGNWKVFIFGNLSLIFRLFYPHHAPSSEGQLSPLITGEGERNSSNTHFGTAKRAGGEGG